jgi:hypothetical protein
VETESQATVVELVETTTWWKPPLATLTPTLTLSLDYRNHQRYKPPFT